MGPHPYDIQTASRDATSSKAASGGTASHRRESRPAENMTMKHDSNDRSTGFKRPPIGRALVASLLVLSLSACSGYKSFRRAQVAEVTGDWDQAVLEYLELVASDPANLKYRGGLMRAKIQASHQHFERAKEYREAEQYEQAMIELQQSVQLDPTNQYALSELNKMREIVEAQRSGETVESIAEMKDRKSGALAQPPVLNPRSPEPINVDFPEPASVKQIYQALGKAFGINVLFDPKLRDQEISIQLSEVTARDALEILMRTAGHFYKVLDEHSIIVVADTPQNRRNYEDLIIQTFFLSNGDVREVMTMLRSLVDSRKIASNEQLNAIILRDTADKVKVAERIIQANDKSKAEVVVDVELLQLNTVKLQELGMSLTQNQIGVELDNGGEDVPLRLNDIQYLDGNSWLLTLPNFLFDFVKNSTDAQTLAKPQLRISEGERARLHIGERVPIPVTSFNSANTVGSNIVPITSFQYQDVGIRIEIEPRVHHNEEISLQITVEVSNVAGEVGDQPIIGTRTIETSIRLKDGETNFLAGLIRSDETNSESGVPGLSEIPLLGRLFSRKSSQNQRTDIMLTLTPHIIRRANITEEDLTPIWVGTESNITFQGGSPRVESDVEGPFDEDGEDTDPAEEMRRRLQQLPRGLRPGADQQGGEDANAPPAGTELVPPPTRNPLDRRPPPQQQQEDPPGGANSVRLERLPGDLEDFGAREGAGGRLGAGVLAGALGVAVDLVPMLATAQAVQQPGIDPDPGNLPAVVRIRSPSAPIRPGEFVEVTVSVNTLNAFSHVPMIVRFDADLLQFISASAGSWFDEDGQAGVLADANAVGRMIVGASRFGQVDGVNGSGDVVVFLFRGLGVGTADVELRDVDLLDPDLNNVRSALGNTVASVTIEEGETRVRRDDKPRVNRGS